MVRREPVSRPCRTPLCPHLVELLKQYLGLLVPCIPGEVAKNAEFRWLASVESKQQAYRRRTLGEREPASCHLGIFLLRIQNTDRSKSAQALLPPPSLSFYYLR